MLSDTNLVESLVFLLVRNNNIKRRTKPALRRRVWSKLKLFQGAKLIQIDFKNHL